jgi:mycothiol synthase
MKDEILIRNYRPDDLPSLVALINETDAVEKLERATTLQEMELEMTFPTVSPETDCFLAWAGDRLVGYADLYVRKGNGSTDQEGAVYCWGAVHPQWRRHGLGRRLMDKAQRRAVDYLDEIRPRRVHLQCSARDVEQGRHALFQELGMKPVRYFVNLARPINGNLPPVEMPAGIRLRTFDPGRDAETVWRVDNAAFRDHWGHTQGELEEFLHWITNPDLRPDLWFLAEDEASGEIVGLSLNMIYPDWIAQTGRQEGYVDSLAVLRQYRQRGLGTALLVQSLHALRQAGMEAAHLHADADNLTGAMRLYERVGFRVRKKSIAYRKLLRDR